MEIIAIIKWIFVVASVLLTVWMFRSEQAKIREIRKQGVSKEIVKEFQEQARKWTQLILFIFMALLIWMLSYDFVVQDVSTENKKLSQELAKVSLEYNNLEDNRQRLLIAQSKKSGFVKNIESHYTKVFTNYYLMRQCKVSHSDDVFIINSAMMRELALNNMGTDARKTIISAAKSDYKKLQEDLTCSDLHGRNNDIILDYQSYIITTREVLKSTF